ncbi:unnamed protein product [Nesidiocoris tenuis]|uniref:Uncharacterized protein n=1 Tax=Nesidiocoris tenuis TaxID=355587 RepID=A0A6H5H9S2_9HEMI|nr:unnamed protein product [Nesidiocoris tenuis]
MKLNRHRRGKDQDRIAWPARFCGSCRSGCWRAIIHSTGSPWGCRCSRRKCIETCLASSYGPRRMIANLQDVN